MWIITDDDMWTSSSLMKLILNKFIAQIRQQGIILKPCDNVGLTVAFLLWLGCQTKIAIQQAIDTSFMQQFLSI